MSNGLYNAIKMDLDAYPLKEEAELKGYVRFLIAKAYYKYIGDTKTQLYAATTSSHKVKEEVIELAKARYYKADLLLSDDDLLEYASDEVVNRYNEERKLSEKDNVKTISSFNEVMQKALSYYQEKQEYKEHYQNLDTVTKFAEIILYNYFYANHEFVFSSKNGTRSYVIKRTPEQILKEMEDELKMTSNPPDATIGVYAKKIANSWMSNQNNKDHQDKNDLNNVINMIISEINNARLNDRQKDYLRNEFQNGNVDALERYVPQELIDEYKRLYNLDNGSIQNRRV